MRFVAQGLPRPQGSTRAFFSRTKRKVFTTTDTKGLYQWRRTVATAASVAKARLRVAHLLPGPVGLRLIFAMPKGKTKRFSPWTHTRPDVDKLTRAVLDAMTGVVYADDAQVVYVEVAKVYRQHSFVAVEVVWPVDEPRKTLSLLLNDLNEWADTEAPWLSHL